MQVEFTFPAKLVEIPDSLADTYGIALVAASITVDGVARKSTTKNGKVRLNLTHEAAAVLRSLGRETFATGSLLLPDTETGPSGKPDVSDDFFAPAPEPVPDPEPIASAPAKAAKA